MALFMTLVTFPALFLILETLLLSSPSLATPTYTNPRRSPHAALARSPSAPTAGKRGSSVPLVVRAAGADVEKREDTNVDFLLRWKSKIGTKYGAVEGDENDEVLRRAGSDTVTLTDLNTDGSYSVSLSIGTPPQTFLANLDTGSADFWLISSACTLCGTGYTEFDSGASTSFDKANNSFTISYGSGTASGGLGTDEVTIGDYTVAKQTLGIVTSMTSGLVTNPNSGLMGMGFQGLAISGATPWWQTLATDGVWSDPLFGVSLARFRDVAGASSVETAGGTVTLGHVDSSLYSGDINYIDVTTGTSGYWNIPIAAVTSQGTGVTLSAKAAAIDTGTTLIGGPASDVAAIYAAIPGSVALTGSLTGYYGYPCTTDIDLTFTFGTFTGTINENDFNIGTYSSDTTMCTGGVYAVTLSSSSPVQWVLGDVFLKNVYSVYRYNPASVGFAALPGVVVSSSSSVSTIIPVATSLAAVNGTASFAPAANATTTAAMAITNSSTTAVAPVVTVYSTAAAVSTTAPVVATVTSAIHVASNASTSSSSGATRNIALGGAPWLATGLSVIAAGVACL